MLPKMAVKYIITILFTVLELTSSISPQHTTAGKRFVYSLTVIGPGETFNKDTARIRLYTEEEKALVKISVTEDPSNLGGARSTSERQVDRYSPVWITLSAAPYYMVSDGIYQAFSLESNVTFSSLIYLGNTASSWDNSVAWRLLPMDIWSTSYYVSTAEDTPFIAVMNGDSEAKVGVSFPNAKIAYGLELCGQAGRNCTRDELVDFTLNSSQVWYYEIRKKGNISFQNTLITADAPIYVIAGNKYLQFKTVSNDWDSCAMSLKPTKTWGKEYVIPVFTESNSNMRAFYRITAKGLPFKYTIYRDDKEIDKELTDFDHTDTIENFTRPVVVIAEMSFGLYQYVAGSGSQPGCLDVMPTEQWGEGFIFYVADNAGCENCSFSVTRVLITTATQEKIIVSGKGKANLGWQSSTIAAYNNRSYSFGNLMISKYPVSIYSKDPLGRLMIYQKFNAANKAHAYIPLSSYRAIINDELCGKTEPEPNDGVDNDCDGLVDEEWENGEDDDGDGETDEDFLAAPGKHEWMPWKIICSLDCDGDKYLQKERVCNRNKFGYTDGPTCEGNDEECDPGPACPTSCEVNSTICGCQSGCAVCESMELLQCSECKDGFMGTFCTVPCPEGFRGETCEDVMFPKEEEKEKKKKKEKEEDEGYVMFIIIGAIAGLVLAAIVVLYVQAGRRKNEKRAKNREAARIEEERKESMRKHTRNTIVEDEETKRIKEEERILEYKRWGTAV